MDNEIGTIYEFGTFRLDAKARRLLRAGEPIAITSKVFDLLLMIVQSGGEVISKDDLIKRLWPDTIVEEHNLTQNISVLRKALGEAPTDHRYIVTVPGAGYRFIADVREIVERESSSTSEVATMNRKAAARSPLLRQAASRAFLALVIVLAAIASLSWVAGRSKRPDPIKSIAVFPFHPLDEESCHKQLAVAMADALTTRLLQVGEVKVSPTGDVLKHGCSQKDLASIGREMGVDALLEGKIQKDGDRIRITVQLLRAEDGSAIWGEKFYTEFTDRFSLQDAVSEQIVRALTPQFIAARTVSRFGADF